MTSAGDDYRHMIRAGGSTIIVSRQSSGANSAYYVNSDHLGSSSAITNSSGGILVNSSFDAFGKRRGSSWTGSPSSGDWAAIASTTRRGFTEHNMLDNLGLIHMNGRVQDPVIGKFLSADPFIDGALNTLGWNRFAYVKNNPLSRIDTLGFMEEIVVTGVHHQADFSSAPRLTDFSHGMSISVDGPDFPEVEVLEEIVVTGKKQEEDPCPDRFVGDAEAQDYLNRYGDEAWGKILTDPDVDAPVAVGTRTEAVRNAEHYLYAYSYTTNIFTGTYYQIATIGYHEKKFWSLVGAHFTNRVSESFGLGLNVESKYAQTIPTLSELAAGIAGADDRMWGRPAGGSNCSRP